MTIGFMLVDDSIVIVRHSNMYKQCQAYHRAGKLYAGVGGAFARLREDGATCNPKMTWEDIEGVGSVERKPTSCKWVEYCGAEK
jgi:hypothetical protein